MEGSHFQAFRPGSEAWLSEAGAENHLHLPYPRNGIDREHPIKRDAHLGFFPGFARGTFFDRLTQFHIAGGDGPEAGTRFNGAAAEQDVVPLRDHAAHHHFRVFIGDMPAIGAHQTLSVVAFGYLANEVGHRFRNCESSGIRISPMRRDYDKNRSEVLCRPA